MRETRRLPLNLLTAFFVASALLLLTSPLAEGFCNNAFPPGAAPPAAPPACAGAGGCGGPGGSGGGVGAGSGGGAGAGQPDQPGPASPSPAPGPTNPPPPPGTVCCNNCTGSPCYVASGVYETRVTDLELPTAGFSLLTSRTYQSSHTIDGPTGYGWTSNLAAHLYYTTYLFAAPSTYQREADITMPQGVRLRFVDNGNGTFTPPANRYDTLVMNGDGTWDLTVMWSLSVFHFNADGSLASQRDDYANILSYSYDASGRLQQVTDASGSGRFLNVFWGADGRISSVQDSAGRQVSYSYNSSGLLTSASDPLARSTHYTYAQGRFAPLLAAITDNWNRVVSTITYDAADRTQSYTEDGETYTYTYKFQGDPTETAKVDSLGNTWVFRYGATGPISDAIPPAGVGGGTVHKDYYGDSSLQQLIDAVGVRTYYTYDAQGQILSVTADYQGPTAVQFDRTYDPNLPARLIAEIAHNPSTGAVDANWQSWRYDYYQAGDPVPGALHHSYRVESDGATLDTMATYAYDGQGRLTSTTDADGGTTSYGYDSQGNLATVTYPSNNDAETLPVTRYVYDATGQPTTVTDPLGNATTTTYDAIGRELTSTLPPPAAGSALDFTTHYSYDNYDSATGLAFTRITDPNGTTTQVGYDAFGRIVETIDASGAVTTYGYSHDLLVNVTDANGNVMRYGYDGLKRLTTTTFPDGAQETYTYLADGLRQTKTDRNNRSIHYAYDRFKRLTTSTYPSGATISYAYQGGRLVQVVDIYASPSETHTFTYDGAYRVASETQGARGTLNFTYTPGDRRATYAVSGGASAAYTYYPDGALDTIQWSAVTGAFKYNYDLGGRFQEIDFPNAQHRAYSYDAQGRLVQLANVHPTAGNLATYTYGYDVVNSTGLPGMLGQRTSLTADVPSQGLAGAFTKYYYDAGYRLTGADYPNAPPFNGEMDRWTYDPIGNRLTAAAGASTATYTYQKVTGNTQNWQRLTSDGTNSYGYDANGNTTTTSGPGGALAFVWDYENRMTSISGGTTASYTYDYLGRRSAKTVGSATTLYLYDGLNLVGESGGSTASYLFGPGIDQPLAMNRGGSAYYYDVDGLGSATIVSDANCVIQDSYTFDAWGVTKGQTGTLGNPFGYTARELGDAGDWFYRARYYRPGTGRFDSEDPLTYLDMFDLYSYASLDPIQGKDPLGLLDCTYNIGTGTLNCTAHDGQTFHSQNGNSGRGQCLNNPACAGTPSQGPIPPGNWNMGRPGNTPTPHTPDRIPLHSDPTTRRGRDGFQLHPGGPNNSEGCIVLPRAEYNRLLALARQDPGGHMVVTP
jgi:RHS repeat-associated protein